MYAQTWKEGNTPETLMFCIRIWSSKYYFGSRLLYKNCYKTFDERAKLIEKYNITR